MELSAGSGVSTLRPCGREELQMTGFVTDIEAATTRNTDFRRVLHTGHHLQLVLMTLQPGEDIGAEIHATHDQFFRIEAGNGSVVIDGKTTPVISGWAMIVPAGARHNVTNTGTTPLQLYTLYAPPQHQDHVVRATKAAALAEPEHFDGKVSA
jgi:mannose-6-phosphate isomerase-like protein (cupin superfamily)